MNQGVTGTGWAEFSPEGLRRCILLKGKVLPDRTPTAVQDDEWEDDLLSKSDSRLADGQKAGTQAPCVLLCALCVPEEI